MTFSDFDVRDRELGKPIVFRASFNRFEPINLSQGWSLMATVGRDDGVLGLTAVAGWFITLSLGLGLILIALEKFEFGTL